MKADSTQPDSHEASANLVCVLRIVKVTAQVTTGRDLGDTRRLPYLHTCSETVPLTLS